MRYLYVESRTLTIPQFHFSKHHIEGSFFFSSYRMFSIVEFITFVTNTLLDKCSWNVIGEEVVSTSCYLLIFLWNLRWLYSCIIAREWAFSVARHNCRCHLYTASLYISEVIRWKDRELRNSSFIHGHELIECRSLSKTRPSNRTYFIFTIETFTHV
jgi:hypothetical protein